jgi:hypothetical protein
MPLDGDYRGGEDADRRRQLAGLRAPVDALDSWGADAVQAPSRVQVAAKEVRRVPETGISNIVDDIGDGPVDQYLDVWARLGAEIIAALFRTAT